MLRNDENKFQQSILNRSRENHDSPKTCFTETRTDISSYRVASLLKKNLKDMFSKKMTFHHSLFIVKSIINCAFKV